MEAARLSIGLMLFQDTLVRENTTASDSFFPMHLMSAMILLGSASDRLRDFFIAAVFHKTTKKYDKGQKRSCYITPFNKARERFEGRPEPVATSIATLPDLAAQIQQFRTMRNKIVHGIATELGRQQQRLVDRPPSAAIAATVEFDWEITDEMLRHSSEAAKIEHRKRISPPIDWYQLLIEAGNHTFIIENTRRCR
jgi:hypothetical protein